MENFGRQVPLLTTRLPLGLCTEQEIKEYSFLPGEAGASFSTDVVRVFFFGSGEYGLAKYKAMKDDEKYGDQYRHLENDRIFRIALEEIEGHKLRWKQSTNYNANCVVCKGTGGSEAKILICDRCLREVHMDCLELKTVPTGDFMCPNCRNSAPLSYEDLMAANKKIKKRGPGRPPKGTKRKLSSNTVKTKKLKIKLNPISQENVDSSNVPPPPPPPPFQEVNSSDSETISIVEGKVEDSASPPAQSISPLILKPSRVLKSPLARDFSSSLSNSTGSPAEAKGQNEACFLCGEPGDGHEKVAFYGIILCDFKGCPRSYHYYCLGPAAPNLGGKVVGNEMKQNKQHSEAQDVFLTTGEEKWYCPYHYCAVCGDKENEIESRLHSRPLPNKKNFKKPLVDSNADELALDESSNKFARCVSCPLGLCAEHLQTSRPVELDDHVIVPKSITRFVRKTGFFRCEYCCTGHSSKAKYDIPESFLRAKQYLALWSRILNKHFRIMEPFAIRPFNIGSKANSLNGEQGMLNGTPAILSFADVREKVLSYKYSTVYEFIEDLKLVQHTFSRYFKDPSEEINDSLNTLGVFIELIERKFVTIDLQRSEPFNDCHEAFVTHLASKQAPNFLPSMYPSLTQLEMKKDFVVEKPTEESISPKDWTEKLSKAVDLDNQKSYIDATVMAEKKTELNDLIEAAKSVSCLP
eukprot:snap_masked-scaffold_20-processed-gene-2.22-mRNA-1 protein AED:1.00 eAED:1.00 QI:0/0/0/0/1/1/9/0/693